MNTCTLILSDETGMQEVVDFCRRYLTVNCEAFASDKLCLVINDARLVNMRQQVLLSFPCN